ncbi:hypothetical protein ABKV19_006474 [Rosa sericea]
MVYVPRRLDHLHSHRLLFMAHRSLPLLLLSRHGLDPRSFSHDDEFVSMPGEQLWIFFCRLLVLHARCFYLAPWCRFTERELRITESHGFRGRYEIELSGQFIHRDLD